MSNEELQKAIDDITNETSAVSDAPAADAAAPADDAVIPAAPAPDAGVATDGVPMPPADAAVIPPAPVPPIADAPAAPTGAAPTMPAPAEPVPVAVAPAPSYSYTGIPEDEPRANLIRIKEDALKELFPLMDKVNVDPLEKFRIYKDIATMTHEKAAVGAAHETIKTIADDEVRAGALIELLGLINNFK